MKRLLRSPRRSRNGLSWFLSALAIPLWIVSPVSDRPAYAEQRHGSALASPEPSRRSATDVPADFLTHAEAASLSHISRHLSDGTQNELSPKSQYSVALALAALGKGASEGDAVSQQAFDALKAGQLEAALAILDAATEAVHNRVATADERKDAAMLWRTLGAIAGLVDDRKAMLAYTKASALDPDDAMTWLWIGGAQIEALEIEAAETSLRRAVALAATDPAGLVSIWARQDLIHVSLMKDADIPKAAQAALAADHETADIIEKRLAVDATDPIWRRELYVVMRQQAGIYMTQDNKAAALKASQDALAIINTLAASDPDNLLWQQDLISAYQGIATASDALGDKKAATEAASAALGLANRSAQRDPDAVGRLAQIADAGRTLAKVQGQTIQASISLDAALKVYDRILASAPNNIRLLAERSKIYERLGDLQDARGNFDEADEAYIARFESIGALERLDPAHRKTWRRKRIILLNKMGPVQLKRHDIESAFASFNGNIQIARELLSEDQTDLLIKGELYLAHRGFGDVKFEAGDFEGALNAYRDALSLCLGAFKMDPTNQRIIEDMADVLDKIGDAHFARNNFGEAEKTFRHEFTARRTLSNLRPNDQASRKALWDTSIKIGESQAGQENLDGAATSLNAAMTILKAIVSAEPANMKWARDLGIVFNLIGGIAVQNEDWMASTAAFSQSQAVLHGLADRLPKDARAQRDLARADANLASSLLRKGDVDQARTLFREGQAIARRGAAQPPGDVDWKPELERIEKEIAKLDHTTKRGAI